ncbi:hypothetical protein GUJ93_ZPchr0014g46572 [Zizania palustris]|uniref:Uncharacterized protein n=1 Tax=Zizania palustris TaxID=103762 RepID=A0A8J5T8S4_ZIZPA|nr:hypothetical protein GUJ93_ZPchr0014g46572 [Zizania palustris]
MGKVEAEPKGIEAHRGSKGEKLNQQSTWDKADDKAMEGESSDSLLKAESGEIIVQDEVHMGEDKPIDAVVPDVTFFESGSINPLERSRPERAQPIRGPPPSPYPAAAGSPESASSPREEHVDRFASSVQGGVRTRAGEIEAAALHRSKFGVLAAAEKTLAKIMASLADYFLADLDELSDNEAYPEEENAEAAGVEEISDDDMPDPESLNYDDLDSFLSFRRHNVTVT